MVGRVNKLFEMQKIHSDLTAAVRAVFRLINIH